MKKEDLESKGFSPEQIDIIIGMHDKDVEGLKSKNSQLIEAQKSLKEKLGENEQATEDARKVAAQKEEERLKLVGDIDGLKAHYESQLAEKTALLEQKANAATQALLDRDFNQQKMQILVDVDERFKPFVSSSIDSILKVSMDESGKTNTSFVVNGNEVAKNASEFIEYAKKEESWKSVLKASNTSGSGASSSAGPANNNSDIDHAFRQRLRDAGL